MNCGSAAFCLGLTSAIFARGWCGKTELDRVIATVKAAAVIVGQHGFSYWLNEERRAFDAEAKKREFPIIPVILPDVKGEPKLPLHLEDKTWVDLRTPESNPLERLVWGITGKKEPFSTTPPTLPGVAGPGKSRSRWFSWWKDRGVARSMSADLRADHKQAALRCELLWRREAIATNTTPEPDRLKPGQIRKAVALRVSDRRQ